jgi:hypothetical protein
MFSQLNLQSYILIAIALISHHPYGKFLGIKYFFNRVLVGLSVSGLIVGTLANFASGLIYPYVVFSIAFGYILSIYSLSKSSHRSIKPIFEKLKKKYVSDIYLYTFLCTLGLIILYFNNPRFSFIEYLNGETFFYFNRHLSYYASQSIEMLHATYLGRLRILNFYPYEWSQYHFFNASVYAISQGLVKFPSLLTYLVAQIVLIIFIVSALLESLIKSYKIKYSDYYKCFFWLLLGFSVFGWSLKWNLFTTGAFSVFAIVNILILISKKEYHQSFIYLVILGVSAIRLMPLAVIIFLLLCILDFKFVSQNSFYYFFQRDPEYNISSSSGSEKSCSVNRYIYHILFILYNVSTLFSGNSLEKLHNTLVENPFSPGGMYGLAFYKLIGVMATKFAIPKAFPNIYNYYENIRDNNSIFYLLCFWIGIASIVVLKMIYLKPKGSRIKKIQPILYIPILSVVGIVALITLFFSPSSVSIIIEALKNPSLPVSIIIGGLRVAVLLFPYLVSVIILSLMVTNLPTIEMKYDINRTLKLLMILQVVFFFFQFLGINSGIKVPILYIVLDVSLWTVIGIVWIAKRINYLYHNMLFVIFIISSTFIFTPHFTKISRMFDYDNHYIKISITELSVKEIVRSDYVDDEGFFKIHYQEVDKVDFYSALLGARVKYNELYKPFMNYRFLGNYGK